jgi:uncharacterized protein YbjT (DUF2867 family)
MAALFLTGATGHVGVHITTALAGRVGVRALAHTDRSAALLANAGFDVTRGDLADLRSFRDALVGVDRLLLLSPPAPHQIAWEPGLIDAAEGAGVAHIVKISTQGVEMDPIPVLSRPHAESEARLSRSSCAVTLLRPDPFMTNFVQNLGDLRAGRIAMPAGDTRITPVDPRDLADLAVLALTAAEPPTGPVPVSGPELLSFVDIAAKLSVALGREILYEPVEPAEFRAAGGAAGMPAGLVEGILDLYTKLRTSAPRGVLETQQSLLGRPARTLEEWLAEEGAEIVAAAIGSS